MSMIDYPLSLLIVNYKYVWSTYLYDIATPNIDILQNFDYHYIIIIIIIIIIIFYKER